MVEVLQPAPNVEAPGMASRPASTCCGELVHGLTTLDMGPRGAAVPHPRPSVTGAS